MPAETYSSKTSEDMAQFEPSGTASITSGPAGTNDSAVAREAGDRTDPKSDDVLPAAEAEAEAEESPPAFGKFPSRRVVPFEIATRTNTNTRRGRYERRHRQNNRVAKLNTRQVTLDNLPRLTAKLKAVWEDNPGRHGGRGGSDSKGTYKSNLLEKSYHLLDSSRGPEAPNGVDRFIEAFNQAKAMKEEDDAILKRRHCQCGKGDGGGNMKEGDLPRCRHSSASVDQVREA